MKEVSFCNAMVLIYEMQGALKPGGCPGSEVTVVFALLQ